MRSPTHIRFLGFALGFFSLAAPARADDDLKPMFNGKDLDGWAIVNVAPSTFTFKDGVLISTGLPTGVIRTTKQFENFILELEWRHMKKGGNAGVFIWGDPIPVTGSPFPRGVEVQVLDGLETPNYTSHGDLFGVQGAKFVPDRPHPGGWDRCLPSEKRCKPTGEWNHYRVECNDGVVKLAVNGKVVSGGHSCSPRKGYLFLESEGSECQFRNVKIKELPSTNAAGADVALLDEGFVPLYTGVDLAGWKHDKGHEGHWRPSDWRLTYDGKSDAKDKNLWTEESYGDFEMIVDWRLSAKPHKMKRPVILPNGDYKKDAAGANEEIEVMDAGDSGIYVRGNSKSQVNIWCWPIGSGEVYGYRNDMKQPAEVRAGVTPRVNADKPIGQWNRFRIMMKGDRLSVNLNGQQVLDNAQLPGVPKEGPIALQHHNDPIEFSNIHIRKLD